MKLHRFEKYVAALVLLCFASGLLFGASLLRGPAATRHVVIGNLLPEHKEVVVEENAVDIRLKETNPVLHLQQSIKQRGKINLKETVELHNDQLNESLPHLDYDIHAFYYIWYGNPHHNGKYLHWNHQYLPHWDSKLAERWFTGYHTPPDDIGSNFYPELGTYSSADIHVMEEHMKQLRVAGIGVASVSWYPPSQADGQGEPTDYIIPNLLNVADKYKIKLCFHIEPYKGRDASTLRNNLKYIITKYGNHSAFYRRRHKDRMLPIFYIYDSYLVKKEEWARLFTPDGDHSIRNTGLDGIFIGLLVEMKHWLEIISAGFDGFYTYFASDGFSYASKSKTWRKLSRDAAASGMLFIPSVGPGYIDDRVRPWNKIHTKPRNNGTYYENAFKMAVEASQSIISITSFNEWHEGTQIEKAVPKQTEHFQYENYLPHQPDFYLSLTRKWVHKFRRYKL